MKVNVQALCRMNLRLIMAGVALACGLPTEAAEATRRLPFSYAKDAAPVEAPVTNSSLDRIEFRGVMATGSETLVVLFDTTKSRSTVLKLNESVDGLKVTEYQPENERVRVESGKDWKWVDLLQAKVVAAAVPPPPRPANPTGPQPPAPQVNGGQPTGAITQVSDEEVRDRMQRVAEEIRRRRALRRQALQEAQQTPPASQ